MNQQYDGGGAEGLIDGIHGKYQLAQRQLAGLSKNRYGCCN